MKLPKQVRKNATKAITSTSLPKYICFFENLGFPIPQSNFPMFIIPLKCKADGLPNRS